MNISVQREFILQVHVINACKNRLKMVLIWQTSKKSFFESGSGKQVKEIGFGIA